MIKLAKILAVVLIFQSKLQADVAHGVLEKHKNNDVFVCLGIYNCVNLARALNAGFMELHGIDEDEVLIEHAGVIFPQDINDNPFKVTNYHFHHGGIDPFEKVLANINEPMTILLGNHFPDVDSAQPNTLLQELEIIRRHPVKTNTILIDYIHHAGTPAFGGLSLEAVLEKLVEINPDYNFCLEQGGHLESEDNAILVASIPQLKRDLHIECDV